MSYKIAVASSDEKQVDETFGAAKRFLIYEVTDGVWQKLEERAADTEAAEKDKEASGNGAQPSESGCAPSQEGGCGKSTGGDGCGESAKEGGCGGSAGGCGQGGGCGGAKEVSGKVELISDCRCIVCKKIGFHIQKQLERKAISAFDVSCTVEEALEKISHYFTRMDNHESLRVQK